MHRIDTPTAQKDKFGQGKNGFTNGDPTTGTPSTKLNSDLYDALQEEVCTVVERSGIRLDKSQHDQLYQAVKKLSEAEANKAKNALIDGSPIDLNTLNKIAKALGNDTKFSETVINLLNQKLAKNQNGADIPDKNLFLKNLGLLETMDCAKNALDKRTGGTVNGDITLQGTQISLRGDDRKHLGFRNQDGSVRMWLNKDKGGDGVRLNNGEDGGGDWLFHKNGNFHAPSGIVAGGNITVSWGGRTAYYHENGDVTGPIWGGALSAWLNNQLNSRTRTQASGGRGGWWYKDESSGFILQGGVVNRSGDNTRVNFLIGYRRECFGVQMTLSAWRHSSKSNIFATGIENSGFNAVMYGQEAEANWWAVGV